LSALGVLGVFNSDVNTLGDDSMTDTLVHLNTEGTLKNRRKGGERWEKE
jgi:hypothetical protein